MLQPKPEDNALSQHNRISYVCAERTNNDTIELYDDANDVDDDSHEARLRRESI